MKKSLVVIFVLLLCVFSFAAKELVFWHSYSTTSGEYKVLTEKVIPDFEKTHPGVKIVETQVSSDEMRKRLVVSTASQDFPDLMRMDIIWVPQFGNIDVLMKLDKEFPAEFNKMKDEFLEGPLSTCKWDGNYYGLPLDTNTRVLLWNKKLFNEAGLSHPPRTMDEFFEDIKLLTKDNDGDGEIDQWGFADSGLGPWNSIPWIYSAGGEILNSDNNTAEGHVNSKQSVAILNEYKELYDEGCISDIVTGSGGIGALEGYAENIYAMVISGPWGHSIIKGQYPDAEINYALMPAGENGSRSVVGGEDIVMFQSTKYKQEAFEFMKYITSYDVQLEFAKVGQMPVLKSIADDPFIRNHDYFGIYMQQLKTAVARSPHPAWNEIEDSIATAWEDTVIGDYDAKDSLDSAAEDIEDILSEY